NPEAVDVLVEWLAPDVDVEDRLAALDVGAVGHDLTVESAGPQERGVEHVGTVRRRDNDHVGPGVEPVHLDEDLVQGLLALVVRPAETGAALATDGVDLVDEDDARRVALGLVEQVAYAARADAHEHLDELGARDGEEGHARLARNSTREHRLSRAGLPDEQDAARDSRAQGREFVGFLEGGLLLAQGSVLEIKSGVTGDDGDRLDLAGVHVLDRPGDVHLGDRGSLRAVGVQEGEPHHHQEQRQNAVLEDPVIEIQFEDPFRGRATTVSAFDATCLTRVVQSSFPKCAGAATARRVPPVPFGASVSPGTHQTASSLAITGQRPRCDAGIFASVKMSWSFLRGGSAVRSPATRARIISFLRRFFGTFASWAPFVGAVAPRLRRQPFQIISRPRSMWVGGSLVAPGLSPTIRTKPYSRIARPPGRSSDREPSSVAVRSSSARRWRAPSTRPVAFCQASVSARVRMPGSNVPIRTASASRARASASLTVRSSSV